jgi:LPXTG-motif cell wall-anchored protein
MAGPSRRFQRVLRAEPDRHFVRVTGVASLIVTGEKFFLLFVVLGALLLISALVLRRNQIVEK